MGYKVAFANNFGDNAALKCDAVALYHHEVFSNDPITNNLHEYHYYIDCTNGVKVRFRALLPLGKPGEVENRCRGASGPVYKIGGYTPRNSPSAQDSLGPRSINDWEGCIKDTILGRSEPHTWALGERWLYMPSGQSKDGHLEFNLAITDVPETTGRIVKRDEPSKMVYSIDLCKIEAMKDEEECHRVEQDNITWADPRSYFNGAGHWVRLLWIFKLKNTSSTSTWYTDLYGNNVSRDPLENGIKQFFSYGAPETTQLDILPVGADIDAKVSFPESAGIRLPN